MSLRRLWQHYRLAAAMMHPELRAYLLHCLNVTQARSEAAAVRNTARAQAIEDEVMRFAEHLPLGRPEHELVSVLRGRMVAAIARGACELEQAPCDKLLRRAVKKNGLPTLAVSPEHGVQRYRGFTSNARST